MQQTIWGEDLYPQFSRTSALRSSRRRIAYHPLPETEANFCYSDFPDIFAGSSGLAIQIDGPYLDALGDTCRHRTGLTYANARNIGRRRIDRRAPDLWFVAPEIADTDYIPASPGYTPNWLSQRRSRDCVRRSGSRASCWRRASLPRTVPLATTIERPSTHSQTHAWTPLKPRSWSGPWVPSCSGPPGQLG